MLSYGLTAMLLKSLGEFFHRLIKLLICEPFNSQVFIRADITEIEAGFLANFTFMTFFSLTPWRNTFINILVVSVLVFLFLLRFFGRFFLVVGRCRLVNVVY
jgi:hypothetical protein